MLWVGAALAQAADRFIDNGDGTLSDTKTGLMWEKKTPAGTGGWHDVDNRYTWTDDPVRVLPDGGAFKKFLGHLNGAKSNDGVTVTGCFANHCDWRLPGIDELKEIVDPNAPGCIPFFNGPESTGACIDSKFGPTQFDRDAWYWTATTNGDRDTGGVFAWVVHFGDAEARNNGSKVRNSYVRAVRRGP